MSLPRRCTELALVDANTHVGSVLTRNVYGQQLVGDARPAQESRVAADFRSFLLRKDLQAANTVREQGSGPTWSGSGRAVSRIDYVLVPPVSPIVLESARIDYRMATALQLARCQR